MVCITDCELESMMALSAIGEVGDEEQLTKEEFDFQDNIWGTSSFDAD